MVNHHPMRNPSRECQMKSANPMHGMLPTAIGFMQWRRGQKVWFGARYAGRRINHRASRMTHLQQITISQQSPFWFVFAHLGILLLLAACSTPPPPNALPSPSPIVSPSPIPAIPSPSPSLTAPPQVVAEPIRTNYTLYLTLDVSRKHAQVQERIIYYNNTGTALNELVLAVEPNLWPNGFALQTLQVQGGTLSTTLLEGQRLHLGFSQPLAEAQSLTLDLSYTLLLPLAEQKDPNQERPRIYGYSDRQINLTNWYPFIVPYHQGWVLHDPWYYGEHLVYEVADYEVYLKLENASEEWLIAASALPTQEGEWLHYKLSAGRTFTFSLSRGALAIKDEWQGIALRSVVFPPYEQSGKAVLNAMRQALATYIDLFGPYPHASLTAVMGDFNDGMEYSAFFFLPRDFYNLYDGTPKNYLTFIAAHETAHQWWFERVGNDQALEPWLDEALCTYSELLFYESLDPSLIPWWWSYRVDFYQPQGFVNLSIYEGGGFRPYTDAVYLRGAHFLDALRRQLGDATFFTFLREYQEQMNGQIATGEDFFHILAQHTQADLGDVLRAHFRSPSQP